MKKDKTINLKRLQEYLSLLGETNKERADAIGYDTSTVTKLWNGDRQPSVEMLKNICTKCNCSIDYLFNLSDTKTNDIEIKSICNKLSLSEETVKFLIEQDFLNDVHNQFIDFYIKSIKKENFTLTSALVDLKQNSALYYEYLCETLYNLENPTPLDIAEENFEEVNTAKVFAKAYRNLQKNTLDVSIDGIKFKISKIFNQLIDDFAVTDIKNFKAEDLRKLEENIYQKANPVSPNELQELFSEE